MQEQKPVVLDYVIRDPVELNLSYIPFVKDGGLFIPTSDIYPLGTLISINLQLPGKKDTVQIDGKVIWITPKNALHHVLSGIGIQLIGDNLKSNKAVIESALDPTMEVGGYTYGIVEEMHKRKK